MSSPIITTYVIIKMVVGEPVVTNQSEYCFGALCGLFDKSQYGSTSIDKTVLKRSLNRQEMYIDIRGKIYSKPIDRSKIMLYKF